MARRKTGDSKVRVGNVSRISGKVTIAGGDIYEGYTVEQVSLLLKEITTNYRRKPFTGRCPYKGLDVFEEEDADLFFGRERLVEDLLNRVKESRTVFITGPSGSGKSSLVRAGLIHALKDGASKGSDLWLYETMKPGRDPIKELSLAFSRLKGPDLTDYFLAHASESDVLNKCAESALSGRKDQRFLLFVDQFEEVFTQINQEEERQAFINMLAHAGTVENGRVIVLFAMRSDFVSNCATYPALNELLSQEFRQIGAMQPAELVAAIALPAKEVGLPIEDELTAQIINDMKGEPGALPLMQFALKDLFDAQQSKGGVIALTLADYLRHGGIQKSLERHADASLAALDEKSQTLARSIFSGLIEIGRGTQDTKRTALFDELVPANASTEDVLSIVQKLADARLIITDEQAGKDTVTISHEKLIEAWPWLKKLVNENREVITLQNAIANDAKEWDDHKRDPSYLYGGGRLISTIEQFESRKLLLGGLAGQFVQTADMRRRRRQVALIVAISSVIVLLTSAVIVYNHQANKSAELAVKYSAAAGTAQAANTQAADLLKIAQANREFAEANTGGAEQQVRIARSGELAAQAVLERNNNPTLSALLSLEAFRLFDGPRARSLLMDNIQITPLVQNTFLEQILALSPSGRLFATQDYKKVLMFLDMETGKPVGVPLEVHGDTIDNAAFSPDGKIFVSSGSDGIIFWDAVTHLPVGTPLNGGGDIAFSPDGKILASGGEKGFTLWDTTTHESIGQPLNRSGESLAISPDGKTLASAESNTVTLWNVTSNQLTDQPSSDGPFLLNFNNLAFSPDGKYFASGSHEGIILWDVSNHEPAGVLTNENPEPILALAFSPDGRILVSGSAYSTISLWDVETRQPIGQPLPGGFGYVTNVAFSADGKYLVSGTEDGAVRLWDVDPLSWYQKICQKAERNFTQDEWKQYFPNEEYRITCPQWPAGE